jgi:hypothetical protein
VTEILMYQCYYRLVRIQFKVVVVVVVVVMVMMTTEAR